MPISPELLKKYGLPADFGPKHPNWNIPSKRNKYLLMLEDSEATGVVHDVAQRDLTVFRRPEGQPQFSVNVKASSIGIAISTYFCSETSPKRFEIFLTSIYSLLASEFPGKIVVVDDGSTTQKHLMKIADIPNIQIIYKRTNGGVSRSKNTGIKQLSECEHLFLADDDMLYNGRWWEVYIGAYEKTKIPHFAFRAPAHEFPWGRYPEDADAVNGVALRRVPHPNGCMLYFHRKAIDVVGGFKVMPYKFGFEHLNITERMMKAGLIQRSYDVIGSNDFLHLNIESYEGRSIAVNSQQILDQQIPASESNNIKEPCEE